MSDLVIRPVKLVEGPYDGSTSVASHYTAILNGEVYVYDGGEDWDRFIHAASAIRKLTQAEQIFEEGAVRELMNNPEKYLTMIDSRPTEETPLKIPRWRIHAWMELLKLQE